MKNNQYLKEPYQIEDKEYRNIYGIDLASKNDFFAVVLMQLPPYISEIHKENPDSYLPRLRTLRHYTQTTYPKMMRMLRNELFKRFPPFYIVADYTSEKTFTDYLIEAYDKKNRKMIEPINFNNASKKMLKEDGLNMMSQGFKFPNPEQIPSSPQTEVIKEWFRILDTQLRHEQIITTKANNFTFDHPEGEHNDLAIAWELSAHGCLRFMLKPVTGFHVTASNGKEKREDINNFNSLFPEMNRTGITVKGITGYEPQKRFKRKRGF